MSWIAHVYTTRLGEPDETTATPAESAAVQKIWNADALDACRTAQRILEEAEQAKAAILKAAEKEGERRIAIAVQKAEEAVWTQAADLLNGLGTMRAAFHASVEDEVASLLVSAFERLSDELPLEARFRTVLRELLAQGEGAKFARLRVPSGFAKLAQQISGEFAWATRLGDDLTIEIDKRLTDSVILDTHRFTVQASMRFARDTVLAALRTRSLLDIAEEAVPEPRAADDENEETEQEDREDTDNQDPTTDSAFDAMNAARDHLKQQITTASNLEEDANPASEDEFDWDSDDDDDDNDNHSDAADTQLFKPRPANG